MANDYNPWDDPANYEPNQGQYVGEGAWDDSGNYMGGGDDPYAPGGSQNPYYDASDPEPTWVQKLTNMLNGGNNGQGGKQAGQGFADLATLLGKYGQAQADNRYAENSFIPKFDELMLQAAQNRRTDESDAMKKLAQTNYIKSGGSNYNPSAMGLFDLGAGPKSISDAQKQGASTLEDQMLKRLQPGGSWTPTPLDQYAKAGIGEKIGNWGSLGTAGLGILQQLLAGNKNKSGS